MKNLLKYGTMVIAIVFVLISCDTDPNELGGDFLGIDIDGTIIREDFEVKAFSVPLNAVQTNNFSANQAATLQTMLLGTYNDPVYGVSTYDFVTQVSLATPGRDFGTERQLDSVVLTVPYYSTVSTTDAAGSQYVLDSVYGGGTVDFKMFRSNFFLNNFDPENVNQAARYFSDLGPVINANKGDAIRFLSPNATGALVESDEITNFSPSPKEVRLLNRITADSVVVTESQSPRLRQRLAPSFWNDLILENGNASYLSSNSNFQNFFRGLYFQVTNSSGNGNLSYLNLNGAQIILYYKSGDVAAQYIINLNGNRANLLQTEVPPAIQTQITNSFNPTTGSDRLYLKGGPGAIALIDLFGPDLTGNPTGGPDGEADALTALKARNVLVNEANIEFYVDQDAVADDSAQPERILIYDYVTNTLLADYEFVQNTGSQNLNHLGPLTTDASGSRRYRIRLSNHIRQILDGVRDNNRLAIVVSQDVSVLGFSNVKNQTTPITVSRIPSSGAISHEGTVLHGNLSSDLDKRLKLKVFFTEIN